MERGQNPLFDILRAGGEHQQQLGGGGEFFVGGIEQNAPNLLADGRSARLDAFQYVAPLIAQPLGQHAGLSALTAAVGSFKGDEESLPTAVAASRRHSAGPFSDPPTLPSLR